MSLTKNPKKRPSAEKMLYLPFVLAGDLSVRLSLELLNKVQNPESLYGHSAISGVGVSGGPSAGVAAGVAGHGSASTDADGDDDGVVIRAPPARIESRVSRTSQKTKSELKSEYTFSEGRCACHIIICVYFNLRPNL